MIVARSHLFIATALVFLGCTTAQPPPPGPPTAGAGCGLDSQSSEEAILRWTTDATQSELERCSRQLAALPSPLAIRISTTAIAKSATNAARVRPTWTLLGKLPLKSPDATGAYLQFGDIARASNRGDARSAYERVVKLGKAPDSAIPLAKLNLATMAGEDNDVERAGRLWQQVIFDHHGSSSVVTVAVSALRDSKPSLVEKICTRLQREQRVSDYRACLLQSGSAVSDGTERLVDTFDDSITLDDATVQELTQQRPDLARVLPGIADCGQNQSPRWSPGANDIKGFKRSPPKVDATKAYLKLAKGGSPKATCYLAYAAASCFGSYSAGKPCTAPNSMALYAEALVTANDRQTLNDFVELVFTEKGRLYDKSHGSQDPDVLKALLQIHLALARLYEGALPEGRVEWRTRAFHEKRATGLWAKLNDGAKLPNELLGCPEGLVLCDMPPRRCLPPAAAHRVCK